MRGLAKPEPTTAGPLPPAVFPIAAPPHCTPSCSSAFWVVMTMVAAIWTWGSGMSSCSLISLSMRSRSFS